MSSPNTVKNLKNINDRIAQAAGRSGRAPSDVRLVAVSKTFDAAIIKEVYAAGQRCFGENRIRELITKTPQLPGDCEWHFIGHLQRNKVRAAVRLATVIHAIDSVPLLQRVNRIASEEGRRPVVLLEVNVSGESSKYGLTLDSVREVAVASHDCPHLRLAGLMTMAPYGAPEAELRRVFGGLREARDQLQQELQVELPELSMGMSGDFETAIEEGATLVRVGSAIFGERWK